MNKPTERFTQTVEAYRQYRPSYPPAVIDELRRACGLSEVSVVADVGSGTGFLTAMLLDVAQRVYGVEPNHAMRAAAEDVLKAYSGFVSVAGSAEETMLPDQSVDLITVATAFHWFDQRKAKAEFLRILKPNGHVVLIWNVRDLAHSAFLRDYEQWIINFATDYETSGAQAFDQCGVETFFSPNPVITGIFPNEQVFDWNGLLGRVASTSYLPKENDPNYPTMIAALKRLFDQHQREGHLSFLYKTTLYYARLHA